MEALINALGKFLMRDLSFIVGGSAIILSFLFVFEKPNLEELSKLSIVLYFVGAGFAYAVGYSVQEVFTLLGLVRTKAGVSPNWFCRVLYRLFERRPVEFPVVDRIEYDKAKLWLFKDAPKRFQDDHERTESLKQVGTTLGPCLIVSAIILFGKRWLHTDQDPFAKALVYGALLLGVILCSLGWLKVTQQAQYLLTRARAASGAQDRGSVVGAPRDPQ